MAHPHRLVVLAAPELEPHWLALGRPSVELVPKGKSIGIPWDLTVDMVSGNILLKQYTRKQKNEDSPRSPQIHFVYF